MSTHKYEILRLAEVAKEKGADVKISYDEAGRIDAFDVTNLKGMRGNGGAVLSTVESLRELIGKDSMRAVTQNSSSFARFYSESQLKAYGNLELMAKRLVMNGEIKNNEKFKLAELGSDQFKYYANINHDLVEFESKEAFIEHEQKNIKVTLSHESFDCDTDEGKKAYLDSTKELVYLGFHPCVVSEDEKNTLSNMVGEIKIDASLQPLSAFIVADTMSVVYPWSESRQGNTIDVYQLDPDNEHIKSMGRRNAEMTY